MCELTEQKVKNIYHSLKEHFVNTAVEVSRLCHYCTCSLTTLLQVPMLHGGWLCGGQKYVYITPFFFCGFLRLFKRKEKLQVAWYSQDKSTVKTKKCVERVCYHYHPPGRILKNSHQASKYLHPLGWEKIPRPAPPPSPLKRSSGTALRKMNMSPSCIVLYCIVF